eukprot:3508735-Prymnesium_polylepis.1
MQQSWLVSAVVLFAALGTWRLGRGVQPSVVRTLARRRLGSALVAVGRALGARAVDLNGLAGRVAHGAEVRSVARSLCGAHRARPG